MHNLHDIVLICTFAIVKSEFLENVGNGSLNRSFSDKY